MPGYSLPELYIVACQAVGVSIKPVAGMPTRHTLGPFSALNTYGLINYGNENGTSTGAILTKSGQAWHATIYIVEHVSKSLRFSYIHH